jgi:hypothetical protein
MPNLFKGSQPRLATGYEVLLPVKRSPSQYADAFLEQTGLGTLASLYKTLMRDQGTPVQVIEKKLGTGLDWRDRTVSRDDQLRNGWLVLERFPGAEGDTFRARVFNGMAGATAEFCLRLKTHESGSVAFHEIRGPQQAASDAHFQLEFTSPRCQMVMAHVSVGMQAASRLMGL